MELRKFEEQLGVPKDFLARVIIFSGANGAFSLLEQNKITLDQFLVQFEAECKQAGYHIPAKQFIECIERAVQRPRPQVVAVIKYIRSKGLKVAALTNNFYGNGPEDSPAWQRFKKLFDVFVESREVGLRKPDPEIYKICLRKLGVEAHEAIFLDDIGANLKSAKELGMKTIKVTDPAEALRELDRLLPFRLSPAFSKMDSKL